MNENDILLHLNKYDYDVRKSKNARWIDQKCTYDVINIIADCILEFSDNSDSIEFTISDIWHSEYARENIIAIFSKPDPKTEARSEYDKYFAQPIKLLAYSGILESTRRGNRYYFKINNHKLLEYISLRPTNSLKFLIPYIEKVLDDSGIYEYFIEFFRLQNKQNFIKLKDTFIDFTINNTPINRRTECGRIFTKVLNPLAYSQKSKGTNRGRLSPVPITLQDLQYNRTNWRDIITNKDKSITRSEHEEQLKDSKQLAIEKYTITKSKKNVRKYNNIYRSGKSEVIQEHHYEKATQIHHIFSLSNYPEIGHYLENLIALTPTQHFSYAHPNNNTQYIDKDYQYICLLSKTCTIMDNLYSKEEIDIYDFDSYITVLNTGLETTEFEEVMKYDFRELVNKIDYFYSDYIDNENLINEKRANYPSL